jgi:hypothetical protein
MLNILKASQRNQFSFFLRLVCPQSMRVAFFLHVVLCTVSF